MFPCNAGASANLNKRRQERIMAGGARGGKRQGVTDLVAGGYVREFWDPVMISERPAGFIISIGLWVYFLKR